MKSIVLNEEGKVEIDFSTLIETIYSCPGANSKMTEQGLELVFVRRHIHKKDPVDHPVIFKPGQIGGVITVDPQSKPIYLRSGDKLQKIWEPKVIQDDGKTVRSRKQAAVFLPKANGFPITTAS